MDAARIAALLAECPALAKSLEIDSESENGAVAVSALTGAGLNELENLLARTTSDGENRADAVLVSNARHRQALEAAQGSLAEAERTTEARLPHRFYRH